MTVYDVNSAAWVIWYATWLAAVVFSARTKVQNRTDFRSPGRMFLGLGLWPMFVPARRVLEFLNAKAPVLSVIATPLWSAPDELNRVWFGLVLAGFAFCWWARLYLGRLWSGYTTLKEGHVLIDKGPYGIVRHPIYTGIVFSGLMTAALNANLITALGVVSLAVGVTMIARIEERFLSEQLGADVYGPYAARVAMLVPGWVGRRT